VRQARVGCGLMQAGCGFGLLFLLATAAIAVEQALGCPGIPFGPTDSCSEIWFVWPVALLLTLPAGLLIGVGLLVRLLSRSLHPSAGGRQARHRPADAETVAPSTSEPGLVLSPEGQWAWNGRTWWPLPDSLPDEPFPTSRPPRSPWRARRELGMQIRALQAAREVRRLTELRDSGAISADEYEWKKKLYGPEPRPQDRRWYQWLDALLGLLSRWS
jgi:hypothetical protein